MRARCTWKDWSLETRRLSGRQPGTFHVENPLDGAMYLVVTRDSDGRQWNTVITNDDAARELIAGLSIAFPHLMGSSK